MWHESVSQETPRVLGSQVQSPVKVNLLLNLFCSSPRSNTKIPILPTLCNYGKHEGVMLVRNCGLHFALYSRLEKATMEYATLRF